MKTVAVVATLLVLCSGHVIPSDNEGDSRYVWMPVAEGEPLLMNLEDSVDEELLKTRNGANNQYLLYTRFNPRFPQVLLHGNTNSIIASLYDSRRPLNVIVHGWSGEDLNAPYYALTTSALLAAQHCNVIVVDWRAVANSKYVTAGAGVPSVGEHLGEFLNWLINVSGGNWNQVHLIGFGLGAHVAGTAGRHTGGRPAQITGLDPAGPLWLTNPSRLNSGDGRYVEVIHTDGHGYGIHDPSGDADFYPYRGLHPQPGCDSNICSHNRATQLFDATVRFSISGRQCVDLVEALQGACDGAEFPMGNSNVNKKGKGIFGFRVAENWLF